MRIRYWLIFLFALWVESETKMIQVIRNDDINIDNNIGIVSPEKASEINASEGFNKNGFATSVDFIMQEVGYGK